MNRLKYRRLSSCATDLEYVRCCFTPIRPAMILPKMTLQQFNTHIILSRGALYVLIFNSSVATSGLNWSCGVERCLTLLSQHQKPLATIANRRDVQVLFLDPPVNPHLLG